LAPATLTAEPGLPTRASASVAISIVAGTTTLAAAAKPKSENAPRREIIISDLIFSFITTSGLISKLAERTAGNFDACQQMAELFCALDQNSDQCL
jgi:hypothetical protein